MKEIKVKNSTHKNIISIYLRIADISGFLIIFWLLLCNLLFLSDKINSYKVYFFIIILAVILTFTLLFKNVFMILGDLYKRINVNERIREEWIANISHDLKSPLLTIRGYSEILQSDEYELTKDELKLYAGEIKKSEQRIDDLIEEIKVSQKLKEGKLQLKKEIVNINELIQECIDETGAEVIGESKIFYEKNKDIFLYCDRSLIKRSIENIIHNAFVHNQNNIELYIKIEKRDEKVCVNIKDTGKGMSEEEMLHIFERYFRGSGSKNVKGSGLGLAIANEVIMAHKGTIKVKSETENGLEFYIEI